MAKFTADPKAVTLETAKEWLRERVRDGAECPCCTQFAKVYKRKLNSSMGCVLILVNRFFRTHDEWLHIPSYLAELGLTGRVAAAIRGDWAKLIHWGLLEECSTDNPTGRPRAGYYKITKEGRDFVAGVIRMPKHVLIYNQQMLRVDDTETTSIHEALGDRFDYAELMRS